MLISFLLIILFSFEGLIYIVGGCTHSRRHLQDLLSFNPVTGEWSTLPPMLVPRSQMGVAVLDGYLYVVGGTNRHHEVLQSVERYSFEEVCLHHNSLSPAPLWGQTLVIHFTVRHYTDLSFLG